MTDVSKGQIWTDRQTHIEERWYEETQDGHLQAKERGIELTVPSQPSEGINPADNLSLDF